MFLMKMSSELSYINSMSYPKINNCQTNNTINLINNLLLGKYDKKDLIVLMRDIKQERSFNQESYRQNRFSRKNETSASQQKYVSNMPILRRDFEHKSGSVCANENDTFYQSKLGDPIFSKHRSPRTRIKKSRNFRNKRHKSRLSNSIQNIEPGTVTKMRDVFTRLELKEKSLSQNSWKDETTSIDSSASFSSNSNYNNIEQTTEISDVNLARNNIFNQQSKIPIDSHRKRVSFAKNINTLPPSAGLPIDVLSSNGSSSEYFFNDHQVNRSLPPIALQISDSSSSVYSRDNQDFQNVELCRNTSNTQSYEKQSRSETHTSFGIESVRSIIIGHRVEVTRLNTENDSDSPPLVIGSRRRTNNSFKPPSPTARKCSVNSISSSVRTTVNNTQGNRAATGNTNYSGFVHIGRNRSSTMQQNAKQRHHSR